MMDRDDLIRAARANSDLDTAERHLDALAGNDYKVVAITIDTGDGSLRPITLARGSGGTGTINSIGYSDGLKAAMTKAMYDYSVLWRKRHKPNGLTVCT